jgi:hypothetical protein
VSRKGEYTNPIHLQFVEDMDAAGLEVQHYRGPFYWEGLAVEVDDLQEHSAQPRSAAVGPLVTRLDRHPTAYGDAERIEEEGLT